jgi:glycosyltransferase involved in cell wall biosynthesis
LGEFDNARANEVYAGMDALVIPSIWWENAPLTLFEAGWPAAR